MGSGVSCVGAHDGMAGAARVRQLRRPGRELGPQGVTPAHQPPPPPVIERPKNVCFQGVMNYSRGILYVFKK